jgi:hypothetical protein
MARYVPPKAAAIAQQAPCSLRCKHKLRTYLDNL